MHPEKTRLPNPPAQSDGLSLGQADAQIIGLGLLVTTVVLSYFYAVDNFYLSTKYMSPIFDHLLMVDDFNTAWPVFGTCALAVFWRRSAPILKMVNLLGTNALPAAVLTAVAVFVLARVVYHGNAFSMDEYAAVFQAKIFASGHLTTFLPPSVLDWLIPPGFNGAFLVASKATGQTIEGYWPGFSLLLAPFEFLGVPALCNALLAALAVFLVHRITMEITDDRGAAGWAVLFTIASGTFVANAVSFYSMQAHLTTNLLFAWLLMRPTPIRSVSAGFVGSVALVLHNPFPHVVFAAPWIIALARSQKVPLNFLWLIAGYLPVLILVGGGWMHLRGEIATGSSGLTVSAGQFSAFAFPDKSMVDMRIAAAVKMWIWAAPCLFLFAFLGGLRRRNDPRVRLLAASAALTFLAYLFVIFDQGHGWGYRYFHSAWGVVPILAGCAMTGRSESNGRLAAFAGAGAILNVFLIIPLQLDHMDGIITRHMAQIPPPHRPGNNVYFVHNGRGFYPADLVQTDPMLRDGDLILFSRGALRDAELRRQNWPDAVLVERNYAVEEWNLGPRDHRRPNQHSPDTMSFEFSYSVQPSSLDGSP